MKNIYPKAIKKFLFFKKSLTAFVFKWLNSFKKDFAFHNSNTELLAIWTVLFMTITGLFVIGLKSRISVILLLLILSFIITLATVSLTTYYLYGLKHQKKKQLLPKIHNILNQSFKLRSLFAYLYKFKNFKYLIKRDFKFAS